VAFSSNSLVRLRQSLVPLRQALALFHQSLVKLRQSLVRLHQSLVKLYQRRRKRCKWLVIVQIEAKKEINRDGQDKKLCK
jgi:hypothetical protein